MDSFSGPVTLQEALDVLTEDDGVIEVAARCAVYQATEGELQQAIADAVADRRSRAIAEGDEDATGGAA